MRRPRMSSVVERRLLVNYRVHPEVAASLLPVPLRPEQVGGWAVAGICLIRLGRLRPRWVPEWDGPQGRQTGVYIPRRASGSVVNVIACGGVFPGEDHRAQFDVYETAQDLHVAFASADGTTRVSVDVRTAQRFQGSRLFADLWEASDFFRRGSAGFSVTRDGQRLDGVELRTDLWCVEPLEVHAVRSSFFDDPHRFPPGSAVLDCALLMSDIPVMWSALEPVK